MNRYQKKFNYLQRLSDRQLEAAERIRMSRDIHYPELFEAPEVWYTHTTKDWRGIEKTLTLLNRQGKRNDSYHIAVNGVQVFFNKTGKFVLNETKWPLILGFSDAMRFWAMQFPRISTADN